MKTTFFLLLLGCSLSTHASTLFEQLCAFNPNWSKYEKHVPAENAHVFLSDKQYIQTHLGLVLQVLESADLKGLNRNQFVMRQHLLAVLSDYRLQGLFPINYYRSERIPVFIDEHNTHCAVGYLMKESGYENLAKQISKTDNYIWVKDLKGEAVLEWQQQSGFTLEELKLIQGAYDSYMPFALEAPNRIEIPQKPEVIALNFKQKDLAENENKAGTGKIWIRGEGKEGVLHGRWEQNYSPTLPWIVGFYQNGKREGKWLEYYQGTNQLCRTEHWKNDQLNGIRTRFDREGNVIEEIRFENGNAVLKINYELGQLLKFVRKPLGENKVWTEIYDLGGRMIASGHETIHNPGNLQWFQNIELTALNTMSLVSQTYSESTLTGSQASSEPGAVRLYNEPTLVEYIKQGDWVYHIDAAEDYLDYRPLGQNPTLFMKLFNRFGADLALRTNHFGGTQYIPDFDSLHVDYSDGNIHSFNGYYEKKRFRMEFEWYNVPGVARLGAYYLYDNIESVRSRRFNFFGSMKSYGFVNENDEKISKWHHFDEGGQLTRVEEFIKPQKKEVALEK